MLYYSTNRQARLANFKDATINGQAPDKGLYFPERIPALPKNFINNIEQLSNEEIAFQVMQPFVGDVIKEEILREICSASINFDIPLVRLDDRVSSLELFHGPTLAFKDVGARFMSRCLGYFLKDEEKEVTVLVATSGDTGGAVASGFYNVPGVKVVILYPSKKVSRIQELQLTTYGNNISAIEVEGSFDDCQHLVKQAFSDNDLNRQVFLTSANSINIARWLSQQIYYFLAYKSWEDKAHPPVFSVPSGNFGNICAGLMAQRTGLPVGKFIASCNANDVVTGYLEKGIYESRKAIPTISNAMDVGDPSNFKRILELFDADQHNIRQVMTSYCFSDEETAEAINYIYKEYHYTADPHGAVAYLGLRKYLNANPEQKGIFLETAHPVKFKDTVESIIEQPIALPEAVQKLAGMKEMKVNMAVDYTLLKDYLIARK